MPLQARAMVSISSRRSGLIRFLSRCRETRNWESVMRFMAGYSMRMPGRIIAGQPTGRIAMPKLFAVVLLALAPIASAPAADSDVLGSILNARVIDLSHTWDESSPIASVNPPYAFDLAATHANTRGTFGDGDQLSFASEVMHWSGQHGAPSIDAIGHIGRDGRLFGGVDAATATSDPDGIGASGVGAQLAIDRFPRDLLVNRGVLLDVAHRGPLAAGYEITGKDLAEAAKRQGVKLKK